MGLPEDLLDQAKDLAGFESKKPKQASLRRAVSASYYALFHLLVRACAQVLAPSGSQLLRGRLSSVLDHTEMADARKRFTAWDTNQPPSLYQAFSLRSHQPICGKCPQVLLSCSSRGTMPITTSLGVFYDLKCWKLLTGLRKALNFLILCRMIARKEKCSC